MEVRNIGFGAVNVNKLVTGTLVKYDFPANPKIHDSIREVLHVGAEVFVDDKGKAAVNLSRKAIQLIDRMTSKIDKISCPANGEIPFLNLLG